MLEELYGGWERDTIQYLLNKNMHIQKLKEYVVKSLL
jgi:hypothetical protein